MLRYTPVPSDEAARLRGGGLDAYSMPPERHVSDGQGMPCRHCLGNIEDGHPYLILAYRPFPAVQPYAETGPILLHAEECEVYDGASPPPILKTSRDYLLRGYDEANRIVYGTGGVTDVDKIEERAIELLKRADIAYVHVRSARNNCFQCRIDKE